MKLTLPSSKFCATTAAAFFFVNGSVVLAQDDNRNEVSALKAQIQQMQKEYEDRITSLEATVKSLQSTNQSGSILNTHVLTDADGKQIEGKAPELDESFLKSLTRNFAFSAYIRAGVQFNGNGGGGNFNFNPPDSGGADSGRPRLGNENDVYMELTWFQAHLLGDSPDVMDVSMTFTPSIRYVQSRSTFTSGHGGVENSGNDFDFVMRQAFLEMSNVFKSAPEITFWGGQRFYDRFNIDPMDYYFLDTSGYGAGVKNIDLGFGKLYLGYIGGLNASEISPSIGTFYKHTIDVRIKDINIGFGTLMPVLIGNFEKGTTFTQSYDNNGNIVNLANPLHADSAWGIGGGLVYDLRFGAGTNNNWLQIYALFGRGATNFSAGTDLGTITGAENYFVFKHPGILPGETINVGQVINKAHVFRVGAQYFWAPAPVFSLSAWAFWEQSNDGFFVAGTNAAGVNKVVSGNRNIWQFGIRPAFWIADNFAIQGQAFGSYQDNNRTSPGTNSFGRSGTMGVFTIAPTLKPKGGYFTRPELRVFATYSIWTPSLQGATTPIQEGGNDYAPPYNGNTDHGWLFGTQVEWYF
jgi:maltoporin